MMKTTVNNLFYDQFPHHIVHECMIVILLTIICLHFNVVLIKVQKIEVNGSVGLSCLTPNTLNRRRTRRRRYVLL